MTKRAAAARYARALFDVSLKEADPRQVEGELAGFATLVRQNPDLGQVLGHPAVAGSRKRAIVTALLERARVSRPLERLLVLLAERDRLVLLPDLVEAYRERVLEHRDIVRAEVTTAVPLAEERAQALARGLSEATGKTVTLVTHVDPNIIGGVVARIGSTIYDGSVTRQLERLREKLVERA